MAKFVKKLPSQKTQFAEDGLPIGHGNFRRGVDCAEVLRLYSWRCSFYRRASREDCGAFDTIRRQRSVRLCLFDYCCRFAEVLRYFDKVAVGVAEVDGPHFSDGAPSGNRAGFDGDIFTTQVGEDLV